MKNKLFIVIYILIILITFTIIGLAIKNSKNIRRFKPQQTIIYKKPYRDTLNHFVRLDGLKIANKTIDRYYDTINYSTKFYIKEKLWLYLDSNYIPFCYPYYENN